MGGINLEDIAAPDCFIIEEKLKEVLDIPIFHDDQHGTAIITLAALINALDISKKKIDKIKIVINGAGASAQACTNLFKSSGVPISLYSESSFFLFFLRTIGLSVETATPVAFTGASSNMSLNLFI